LPCILAAMELTTFGVDRFTDERFLVKVEQIEGYSSLNQCISANVNPMKCEMKFTILKINE